MLLQEFPNDVLLLISHVLQPLDQICLALTFKQFYSIILVSSDHECLNDLIAYQTPMNNLLPSTHSHFTLRLLLVRLGDWVPADHVICSDKKDKYINGGEDGAVCGRCERIARDGKEEKIEELRRRKEKGLMLQWYDTSWLERVGGVGGE